MSNLLLAHAGATWFLVGLSWFVGVVHYPLFAAVGRAEHTRYHAGHVARTTWIVAPAMGIELLLAVALAFDPPAGVPRAAAIVGLALLGGVWLSTALVQVPLHARLERSFDAAAHRRLVWSHHLRSLLWTARGGLAFWWLAEAAP